MSMVTFVIGATASGKSYFIDKNYSDKDVVILNAYDYQQIADKDKSLDKYGSFRRDFRSTMKANQMLLDDILKEINAGRDVVVEQTFYKAKRRIAYIDEIRKNSDVTIDVYLMAPSKELFSSNAKKRGYDSQIDQLMSIMDFIDFPNPSEGFDAIYEVIDGEPVLKMDEPRPEIVTEAWKELNEEAEKLRQEDEEIRREEELYKSMNTRPFWHYCEVCGKKEYITAEQAFNNGWDYPPQMGAFGVLSPRTCGDCGIMDTLWARKALIEKNSFFQKGDLDPKDQKILERILGEPESLLAEEEGHDTNTL